MFNSFKSKDEWNELLKRAVYCFMSSFELFQLPSNYEHVVFSINDDLIPI